MERKKTNADMVQRGDLMAIVTFVKVFGTTGKLGLKTENLQLKDLDTGQEFEVRGRDLIEDMLSADRYETEKKVSRTEMVEILMRSFNQPLLAKFIKVDGLTERRIRGRLVKTEPLFGRSMVEDLDLPINPEDKRGAFQRYRQVDHRTISELIVGGVRYTLTRK